MDLSKLISADEARTLEIVGPDGNPVGLTMQVMSLDCRAARDASRKHADTLLSASSKKLTGEIVEAEGLDRLAACIASWDWHGNEWNGIKDAPLTTALAKEVLGQQWISRQVATFAGDLANFTKPAAKG
jgi:hypothetical protein